MKALQVTSLDGPDGVHPAELPEPKRTGGMVLIDVHVAGVSFVDLLLAQGKYQIQPEPPFVPGIEVSGVVREAPADSDVAPGDRVAAFTVLGGGFAEVALAPSELTFRVPALSFIATAGLLQNYLTAMLGLRRRGRVAPGETVLIHGAAGGVGTAAIQTAKVLEARVLAVTSTRAKADTARGAGADHVLDLNADWVEEVKAHTQGRGVNVVFDPVGGERLDDSLRCLAPEGRLLIVGFAAGDIPRVQANRVLLRHVDIVGVNVGGFLTVDPDYLQRSAAEIVALAETGRIRPVIGARYALEDGGQALRDLAERRALGKLVLETRANPR